MPISTISGFNFDTLKFLSFPVTSKLGRALLIASILGLVGFQTQAQTIEQDKLKHFAVSAAIGGSVAAALPGLSSGNQFLIAMVPGLLKEVYDSRRGGTGFSTADLLADGIGAYAGLMGVNLVLLPKQKGGVELRWSLKF